MLEIILLVIIIILLIIIMALTYNSLKKKDSNIYKLISDSDLNRHSEISELKKELTDEIRYTRSELNNSVTIALDKTSNTLKDNQKDISTLQDKRLLDINNSINDKQELMLNTMSERLVQIDTRFKDLTVQNTASLNDMRSTIQTRLSSIQEDNAKQLENIRNTVDEKLQKTLDEKLSQSFKNVSDSLAKVYAGLGEMQALANGVGDLKKVLSNVKNRGIMGEIQLGAIIEEMLSQEQYATNIVTKKNSGKPVEFAIKLPGESDKPVYLPVDSKFPMDTYNHLIDAYDSGNPDELKKAKEDLRQRILGCAKDISEKYISPPDTTEFAIMFLPCEGLYCEVVRCGLVEELQQKYKVNISGPTTFSALLNSLQMGFRTLTIQKRSSEVWNVLSAVKTEFGNFESVLTKAQDRIRQTSEELDKLVGVRTRKINSKLREITSLPVSESKQLIDNTIED